jgi:hypothetical protein
MAVDTTVLPSLMPIISFIHKPLLNRDFNSFKRVPVFIEVSLRAIAFEFVFGRRVGNAELGFS